MDRFRKVVMVENLIYDKKNKFVKREFGDTFVLLLTAIPFVGTFVMFVYFITRDKNVYFEKI